MTNPEHSTCPKWAAREARRIALEEAAAVADQLAADIKRLQAAEYPAVSIRGVITTCKTIAADIRALAKEPR